MPIDQNLLQIGLGSYDPNAGYSSPRLLDIQSGGLSADRGAPVLAADTASATPAPSGAPSGAPSQAPAGNPDDYETRFRSALNSLEQEALRQKKAAGNPLNVAGSILGGLIGLPLRFIDNAIGGGHSDLSAPFHPKQNAESNYQETLAAIGDKRVRFERDLAALRSSRATELKTTIGIDREGEQAAYDEMGRLASGLLYLDPSVRAQRAAPQLAVLAQRYPSLKGQVDTLVQSNFADDALVTLGSMSKDEGARARVNEYLYGTKTPSLGDGVAVSIPSRPGVAPQILTRGGSVSAAPYIGGAGVTTPPSAPQSGQAPVNVTNFTNIPSANPLDPNAGATPNVRRPVGGGSQAPAAPSVSDIDAELRRRGVK